MLLNHVNHPVLGLGLFLFSQINLSVAQTILPRELIIFINKNYAIILPAIHLKSTWSINIKMDLNGDSHLVVYG